MPDSLHLAIVMDGNGRWAKQRGMPRSFGHLKGVQSVKKTIKYCLANGITELTLFALSSENMSRPFSEVKFLINLFKEQLDKQLQSLLDQNIKIKVIGDMSTLSEKVLDTIKKAEQCSNSNTRMKLNICFNYGGRWHIQQGLKFLVEKADSDINLFEQWMFQDVSQPDLVIRTGGEKRLSNFLLYHMAYSELYFSETLWPDFEEENLRHALIDYKNRQRRFGLSDSQIDHD